MNPVLSVIIPVYNAEKYLDRTLSSVLNQGVQNIEVLCIDDGSTDHSVEIIKKYSALDTRLTLLLQNHQFAGSARNLGINHARGQYIHFLDADDYVLADGYETILPIAIQNDLDCLKFCAETYDLDNNVWIYKLVYELFHFKKDDFNVIFNRNSFPQIFKVNVTPWSGIYKRSFLLDNNILFNNLFCCNDRSFYKEVAIMCSRMMLVKNRVIVHNIGVDGSLVSKRAEHFHCQSESIGIIEKKLLAADLGKEVFEKALSAEFDDLMYWYEKCKENLKYKKRVTRITENLLRDYAKKYPFLSDYLFVYDSIK